MNNATHIVLGVLVGAALQQEARYLQTAAVCRTVQRRLAILCESTSRVKMRH